VIFKKKLEANCLFLQVLTLHLGSTYCILSTFYIEHIAIAPPAIARSFFKSCASKLLFADNTLAKKNSI